METFRLPGKAVPARKNLGGKSRVDFVGKAAAAEPFLGEVFQHGASTGVLWRRAGQSEAFLGEVREGMAKIHPKLRGAVGRWRLQTLHET